MASVLSSCAEYSDWAHRVFLTTNEKRQPQTLATLSRHPVTGNAMMGVSGFFLLNAASVRGIKCAEEQPPIRSLILVDRSQRVEHFWKAMQPLIASARDRGEVIEKIGGLLQEQASFYYSGSPNVNSKQQAAYRLSEFATEIREGTSWLSSDERFARIRAIFQNQRFTFIKSDLFDATSADHLAQILSEQGAVLDTFYISNVAEYVEEFDQKERFRQTVDKLIGAKTFLVQTKPRGCTDCDSLEQQVLRRNPNSQQIKMETLFPQEERCKKGAELQLLFLTGLGSGLLTSEKG